MHLRSLISFLILLPIMSPLLFRAQSIPLDKFYQSDNGIAEPNQVFETAIDAINSRLEDLKSIKPEYEHLFLSKIIQNTDYAIAYFAQPIMASSSAGAIVILAKYFEDSGWEAYSPFLSKIDDYDLVLDELPNEIIDENTKSFLLLSANNISGAAKGFSGYKLPWQYQTTGKVMAKGNCYLYGTATKCDNVGHDNQIDFYVNNGGIYAAKSGTVVFVKESSPDPSMPDCNSANWGKANFVVIQHGTNEYSWYYHLAYNSVPVNPGDTVSYGSRIGTQGRTGYTCGTTGYHLHFMTSTGHNSWTDPNNPNIATWATGIVSSDFSEISYNNLTVGATYTSQNSGGSTCQAPSLSSPSDGFESQSNTINFVWSHPNNCSNQTGYYIRVGTTPGGSNVISNYHFSGLNGSLTFESQWTNKDLYWSVIADATGTEWSDSRRFRITTVPPTGWNITYFSDNNLGSQCGSVQNETNTYIFKDSTGGWSPPSGCPNSSSAWSARLENNNVPFLGGYYEFGLFYDDGARLFIDDVLRVDGWTGTQHYEGHDVSAGNHRLRLEYKNNIGNAIVQLWWRGPGALPGNNETQDVYQWWANYWGNQNQWQDAVGQRNEGAGFLNHDWGNGSPGYGIPDDHFSTRYSRTLNFDCGTYRFHLKSDDGSRLWVDSSLKQDNWQTNVFDEYIDVELTGGNHSILVDHFENGGGAYIYLDWTLLTPCPVPNAPTLISPINDSEFDQGDPIILTWSGDGEQYYGEVWGGLEGIQTIDWQNGTSTSLDSLDGGYTYFWHIKAKNSNGESNWSDTWSFSINTTNTFNFLRNPSFEYGVEEPNLWTMDAWDFNRSWFVWDGAVARSGNLSVGIENEEENDARWIQTVYVQPNTDYLLSGWIKTEGVTHSSPVDVGANISILGDFEYTDGLFGTNDWTYVSKSFNTGSRTSLQIAARLGFYQGIVMGKAWFDDLKLEMIGTPICYNLLTSVDPTLSGKILISPKPNCNNSQYIHGTVVKLTAVPESGYLFKSWIGDLASINNPAYVTMTSDKSITANFSKISYIPVPKSPVGTTYDQTPTYKWTKVSGATKYSYQLYTGTTLVYTKNPINPVCDVTYCKHTPVTTLGYKSYKWRVRAYVGGVWKPWSAYKYFTIARSALPE